MPKAAGGAFQIIPAIDVPATETALKVMKYQLITQINRGVIWKR
jgi:hypothetical protein